LYGKPKNFQTKNENLLMGMCGEFYSPWEYAIILREAQQIMLVKYSNVHIWSGKASCTGKNGIETLEFGLRLFELQSELSLISCPLSFITILSRTYRKGATYI
jgi:hypothetical protein